MDFDISYDKVCIITPLIEVKTMAESTVVAPRLETREMTKNEK
jgi:hypothetical protein